MDGQSMAHDWTESLQQKYLLTERRSEHPGDCIADTSLFTELLKEHLGLSAHKRGLFRESKGFSAGMLCSALVGKPFRSAPRQYHFLREKYEERSIKDRKRGEGQG